MCGAARFLVSKVKVGSRDGHHWSRNGADPRLRAARNHWPGTAGAAALAASAARRRAAPPRRGLPAEQAWWWEDEGFARIRAVPSSGSAAHCL